MINLNFGNGSVIIHGRKNTITLATTAHQFDIGEDLKDVFIDDEKEEVLLTFQNIDSVNVLIECLANTKRSIMIEIERKKFLQRIEKALRKDDLITFCNTGKYPNEYCLKASGLDLLWYHATCAENGIAFNEDDEFKFLEAVARKTVDGIDGDKARNQAFNGK